MKIRHIATRFALLLGIAAIVPLLAYGFVSLVSLQRGTRESVTNGNQNVAIRAAEEIRRYVATNAELLKALSADLQDTGLTRIAAGSDPQELRPAVSRIPGTDAVRRTGRDGCLEPNRQAANHDSEGFAGGDRRRVDVADSR